jgi:hypothetical protein
VQLYKNYSDLLVFCFLFRPLLYGPGNNSFVLILMTLAGVDICEGTSTLKSVTCIMYLALGRRMDKIHIFGVCYDLDRIGIHIRKLI